MGSKTCRNQLSVRKLPKTERTAARVECCVVATSPGLSATRDLQRLHDLCEEELRVLRKESASSLLVTASSLSVAERSECAVSAETTCSFLAAVCCVTAAAEGFRRCSTFCQRSVQFFFMGAGRRDRGFRFERDARGIQKRSTSFASRWTSLSVR